MVTDAGMPCISDPGEELVDASPQELGIPVLSVPGPTAIATAVAAFGTGNRAGSPSRGF